MWSETRRWTSTNGSLSTAWFDTLTHCATMGLRSMHWAFLALSVRRLQADQPDIMPWITWLPGPWHLQAFLFQGIRRKAARRSFSHPLAGRKTTPWNITAVCPLANSYVAAAAREAGSVAELAATWKSTKYSNLDSGYIFQPIAMKTLGRSMIFCQTWVARFLFSQAMIERLAVCISDSVFWFSDLMRFYYMTASSRRGTNGHSSCFA